MKLDLGSGYGDQGEQCAWEGIRSVQERLVDLAVHLRKSYPGALDEVVECIGKIWHEAAILEQELAAVERLAGFDGTIGKPSVAHFWHSVNVAKGVLPGVPDGSFERKVAEEVAR